MPLFMDHHKGVEGLTAEAVAEAHKKDLEIQDEYGVKYHRYWYNEETGEVFCLAEAPDKEAAEAVHREAHGLVAGNLAIQALHICVVSLAESVRIMELVYPIPMRFTDSGKPLWARFSATGGTDMCKGSMAKFVAQQLRLALQPSAHLLQSGNLFVAHCDHKVLPYQNMRLAEVHSLGFVQVTSSLEHDE